MQGDVPCQEGKVSAVELNGQVDALHQMLCNLKLEEQLGNEIVSSINEPVTSLQK